MHSSNPSYSGGRDQEDHSLRPSLHKQTNNNNKRKTLENAKLYPKKTEQKRAGGL
jgi:hypothetical protein